MGFNDSRTPAGWDTHAGRLILQHHAVASGYLAGTQIRPLDGTPRDGQSHFTIDGMTVADLKDHIDAAIAQRGGLQLMLHPSQLDTPGKLTTAQFAEVLDDIVAKRTAGDLVTLSPLQMMVADSTRPAPTVADVQGLAARLADIEYDSGVRDISTTIPTLTEGTLRVQRVGSLVSFSGDAMKFTNTGTFTLSGAVPSGFRPNGTFNSLAIQLTGQDTYRTSISQAGNLAIYSYSGGWVRFYFTWITDDPIPTTLPDTPA